MILKQQKRATVILKSWTTARISDQTIQKAIEAALTWECWAMARKLVDQNRKISKTIVKMTKVENKQQWSIATYCVHRLKVTHLSLRRSLIIMS